MTEEERRLRRKLAGLRTSQSHIQNALYGAGTGVLAQRNRAKLEWVNRQVALFENLLDRLGKRTASQIAFPILIPTSGTRDEFTTFWDRLYSGYDEEFYQRNIGQPLTEARIRAWFEWKNGTPLAQGKAKSILRYSSLKERIRCNADHDSTLAFLCRPGGAIWRIFWAHLQHPTEYPIYDQHVHRAMAFLHGWGDLTIPNNDSAKVRMYLNEYRPFFRQFKTCPPRSADRALWTFGKFIGVGYRGMLDHSVKGGS